MDKTENGWFCRACSREVLDFRGKSDMELRDAFKNLEEQPCGVFRADQVQLPGSARKPRASHANTWKALGLLLAGALAADGCFMGKRAEPKDSQDQGRTELRTGAASSKADSIGMEPK